MGSEVREQIRRRLDAVREADLEPSGERDDGRQPGWLDPEPDTERGWLDDTGGRRGIGDLLGRVRLVPSRRGVVALGVVAVVAAVIGGIGVWRDRPVAQAVPPLPVTAPIVPESPADPAPSPGPTPGESAAAPPVVQAEQIVVSVVGLVNVNGLVHLPPGSRVADALTAAGGTREGADTLGLNLAQKLSDGDQVLVGLAPEPGAAPVAGSATVGAGGGTAGTTPTGPLDLNAATAEQLDTLPGVGPVTAAAIVSWRTTNGRFTDVEQLGEVDGIGPARLDKLRDLVTVR